MIAADRVEAICIETKIRYVLKYIIMPLFIIIRLTYLRTNKKIIELFCHLVCFDLRIVCIVTVYLIVSKHFMITTYSTDWIFLY